MKKYKKEMIKEKRLQRIILEYLANGDYYVEIRKKLGFSRYDMSYCIRYLYEKFSANNKCSLVYMAIRSGDIDLKKVKARFVKSKS